MTDVTCLANWGKANFFKGCSFLWDEPKRKVGCSYFFFQAYSYNGLIKWVFLLDDSPNSSGLGITLLTNQIRRY